jgi:hypothetical protein
MKLTLILMVINNYTPFPTFGKMDVNFLFSCVKSYTEFPTLRQLNASFRPR